MKTNRTSRLLPDRIRQILRRFHPLPEALLGYLFGILTAACTFSPTVVYAPLPMREALTEAISAELPFWIAAALLILFRPVSIGGKLLVFLKAAACGFAALSLLPSGYPSFGYFRYVCVSLLITALYACIIRQATDLRQSERKSPHTHTGAIHAIGDYLIRWLFYSGSAILLLPLKYFNGF